jgi:hypothetical protein
LSMWKFYYQWECGESYNQFLANTKEGPYSLRSSKLTMFSEWISLQLYPRSNEWDLVQNKEGYRSQDQSQQWVSLNKGERLQLTQEPIGYRGPQVVLKRWWSWAEALSRPSLFTISSLSWLPMGAMWSTW